ncbi:IS3 family transposase [Bacillus thuringiensis]|uniref:IS3 family transposase n=1 Tax=Bacillus thuringiensis TaxID=1428 RepID=UPI003D6D1640
MQSFFSHLKTHNIYFSPSKTQNHLYPPIHHYISFYNHQPFHKKLNHSPPIEYPNTLIPYSFLNLSTSHP